LAAAMARTASFCGADGLEIMEPLTFKGREGSSQPGGRNAYLDTSLDPKEGDFAKFEITYRQWGRTLYDPATRPDAWRRAMRGKLGPGADAAQDALAYASRILALLTSAHMPSASNRQFWYEMYVNMGILPAPTPFTDTFDPRVFGNCSALDPQMFTSVFGHADEVLAGRSNCKYSPVEVASWLEDLTEAATAAPMTVNSTERTTANTTTGTTTDETSSVSRTIATTATIALATRALEAVATATTAAVTTALITTTSTTGAIAKAMTDVKGTAASTAVATDATNVKTAAKSTIATRTYKLPFET
jgi:hypothetical protein